MRTQAQINRHIVTSVTIQPNSANSPDLLVLEVEEAVVRSHITAHALAMDRSLWQQVVDQLAELGVVAGAVQPA